MRRLVLALRAAAGFLLVAAPAFGQGTVNFTARVIQIPQHPDAPAVQDFAATFGVPVEVGAGGYTEIPLTGRFTFTYPQANSCLPGPGYTQCQYPLEDFQINGVSLLLDPARIFHAKQIFLYLNRQGVDVYEVELSGGFPAPDGHYRNLDILLQASFPPGTLSGDLPADMSFFAQGVNFQGRPDFFYAFDATTFQGDTVWTSGIVGYDPEIEFLDPVPDLLSGAAVKSDPCEGGSKSLATGGRDVVGAAVDGVALLLLRIHARSAGEAFTLGLLGGAIGESGALGPLGSTPSSPTVTVTAGSCQAGDEALAFALYRPPPDFTWTDSTGTVRYTDFTTRSVTLLAQSPQSNLVQKSITIVRPPVVLVHGYASNAEETWNYFVPFNKDTPQFKVFPIDYGNPLWTMQLVVEKTEPPIDTSKFTEIKASDLGFTWNQPFVATDVIKVLDRFREGENLVLAKVASAQTDVVAHSMGGLVMRFWVMQGNYRANKTFGRGYIHKMITLGTPHFGTPLATLSLHPDAWCARENAAAVDRFSFETVTFRGLFFQETKGGAVAELRGDGVGGDYLSDALQKIRDQVLPFPLSGLAGDVTPILGRVGLANGPLWLSNSCAIRAPNDPLASRFTTQRFATIFDPSIRPTDANGQGASRASDGAVPLTSALMNPSMATCVPEKGCFSGFAHGWKTSLIFAGNPLAGNPTNYLVDASQTVSGVVLNWLNTPESK